MSELVPVEAASRVPAAARVALAADVPSIEELFLFAREAELRVRSLRMTIEDRTMTARGEGVVRYEIQLRHPGQARVTTRRSTEPFSNDYEVWLSDGRMVHNYKAARKVVSVRPLPRAVVGNDSPDLPRYARQREPVTSLPAGSLADTFVHPHGLFRNVLVTGPLAILGKRLVAGREAIVLRSEHPRSAKVLVDRPDHAIEVGIERATGFLVLLSEHVGDSVTRHAEVTELEVDALLVDSTFRLHLPPDVRRLY